MRRKNIKREISEPIDKLTNSIVNTITGDVLQTEFHRIRKADMRLVHSKEWVFDWHEEIKDEKKEVYKIAIKGNEDIIQGLLSLSIDDEFVFMHLVESAKFNRGKDKIYMGVLGNMFAYACKRSEDEGFEGYVMFIAKTALREHYEKVLGAKPISSQRMYIDPNSAANLISQYFKS